LEVLGYVAGFWEERDGLLGLMEILGREAGFSTSPLTMRP
jgi:hypothetical protein